MRVCVVNPDGAYGWQVIPVGLYEVFLDGKELKRCVAADDVTGEAWVHDCHEDGRLKVSASYDVELKKLSGNVEFRKIKS